MRARRRSRTRYFTALFLYYQSFRTRGQYVVTGGFGRGATYCWLPRRHAYQAHGFFDRQGPFRLYLWQGSFR